MKAAESFKEHIGQTENREVKEALGLLAEQCARRSRELQSMENVPLSRPTPSASASTSTSTSTSVREREREPKDSIVGSLATARGMMSIQLGKEDEMDPVSRFQIQVMSLLKPPMVALDDAKPLDVKHTGKTIEELELENATLKQLLSVSSENLQLYESFHKRVRINLKSYLSQLKRDLHEQEQVKKQGYEAKIEALTRENYKLECTRRKLSERWDELVESAKKRREDNKR